MLPTTPPSPQHLPLRSVEAYNQDMYAQMAERARMWQVGEQMDISTVQRAAHYWSAGSQAPYPPAWACKQTPETCRQTAPSCPALRPQDDFYHQRAHGTEGQAQAQVGGAPPE